MSEEIAPDELITGLGHWAGGRGPVHRPSADARKAAVTALGRRLPADLAGSALDEPA